MADTVLNVTFIILSKILRGTSSLALFAYAIILRVILWMSMPIIHIGRTIIAVVSHALHVLAKFELVYMFLGAAVIAGASAGLGMSAIISFLEPLLPTLNIGARSDVGTQGPRDADDEAFRVQSSTTRHRRPTKHRLHQSAVRCDALNMQARSTANPALDLGARASLVLRNTIMEEESSSDAP